LGYHERRPNSFAVEGCMTSKSRVDFSIRDWLN